MRPTGAMHLGHYFGALRNWTALQDSYETFYMVADWHAMTTLYDKKNDMVNIRKSSLEMVADWIACGIDPGKSCIFRQSDVRAHAELFLILSMVTPLGWLMRCPTYKEQLREIKNHDISTFGFLGYPVLQAADILIYKAEAVPVGGDQMPHLEITREIARRFNHLYGKVFPEPAGILTESPKIPGTDGRKMSKSYANAIDLTDGPEAVSKKISAMITDPERIHPTDIGHPEICGVFAYWKALDEAKAGEISEACRNARTGCVACKKALAGAVTELLKPLGEKRAGITTGKVEEILRAGGEKARAAADETLGEIREALEI